MAFKTTIVMEMFKKIVSSENLLNIDLSRYIIQTFCVAFTYWLDRLKSRVLKCRGLPAKVHATFDTVIAFQGTRVAQ